MPTVETDRDTFERLASDAPKAARVPVAARVTVDDPFLAYRRARDPGGGVYLATTGGQSGWGYFGTAPADFLEVGADDGETLAALGELLDGETLVRGDCSVPYPCGAIGWLSYDVARELETLPESAVADRALPQLQVATYDRLAAWEEPRGDGPVALTVTACPRLDEYDSVERAYEFGKRHALELAREATKGDHSVEDPPVETDAAEFESDCTRESFAERVRTVKRYIRDGDTFQANVSQRLSAPAAVHPVEAFDALRTVNPAPYSALVEFPGVDLVSASPELLLHRDGDRLVTEPIAGTRPRGETPEVDDQLEADLLADEKERAEHAMLVDLERNDLGKVSRFGTVEVTDYRRVDRYSEVMHLVSEVEGRLRASATLEDAIAAVFPGGTITGAPKPRTMDIIDEVEETRRGPYTGSIGVFGFDGRATLNIVIRTLVRYADEYHLRVGAGVVHDSDPDSEYDETLDKGRALVNAVDEALGRRADFSVEGTR
ncbi:aminodeoxychorismate synthase, component I [Halomicroarcula limicola]|uniref:anthranilate synthase n=1 Tax=Haloarcula limicola TaxID=1429915 RepID=A0A8J7Y8X7_9EURY|nr:aminodeoxychorismate synthase, component I [Halomicroarcula limicola]MBV0923419.1 aminodeoxychorismate synthase, component I [Halomicroarcula limicola]